MKKLFLFILLFIPQVASCSPSVYPERITLPENFAIEIYAADIRSARAMAFAADGALYVSDDKANVIYRIYYENE